MTHINGNMSDVHPRFDPMAHGSAAEADFRGATMMLDDKLVRVRAHRNNILRYRRLLKTKLSALERDFIERRLSEEEAALDDLRADAFSLAMTLSGSRSPARTEPTMEGTDVCQL